jgi:hypothetical protein
MLITQPSISKFFYQQMHSLLKHRMLQLTLKISLYMAPTCFVSFGPSSGSIRRNLAKVTAFVEIISKNTSLKLLLCGGNMCFSLYSSVCIWCGPTPHSTQYTHYRLKHILPQHSNNFKEVFSLIIFTKTVTLARFRRMLPDDALNGPKHVGGI